MYFSTSLNDEEQKQPATRGELASALYEMKGSPKVDLPEVSPWPDVKTDNPNYAAYIWAREKGVTFGGPDGKFHAEDGLTNATVAAMIYRASGSPEVSGVHPSRMLRRIPRSTVRFCGLPSRMLLLPRPACLNRIML